MTFKKLTLFFFFLSLSLSETFAKDYGFVLKESKENGLYFSLDLQEGDVIYSNIESDSNTFPTSIKIAPSYNLKNYNLKWPVSKSKFQEGIGNVDYFDGRVIIPLELEAHNYSKSVKFKADIEFVVCNNQCIPVIQTIERDLLLQENLLSVPQYLWFIGLAILGGFILNFMPCVLPVLSLKILSFMKNDDIDRRAASAFTIMGILTCFWILAGVMIALKHSGKQFGLGVNFQVPEFIIILSLLITFFVSLSLGRVNFGLSNIGDKLNRVHFSNIYLEHYFSGIIATILSTPCNAPFLGSALAFAIGVSDNMVILMFSSIALGFSAPYIALIIFPSVLNLMPKPGAWMNKFKQFLALLLIGTIAWLLWILTAQIGERAVFGLFLLLLLFKFSLENDTGFLKGKFYKASILILVIAASLILPQYASKEDSVHNEHIEKSWVKFERNKIAGLVKAGNIVFVNITADWCVTCKYNKVMVLNRDGTLDLFRKNKVVAMRGDFTSQDKNIYEFLNYYEAVGIPFYIIYGPAKPDGMILPLLISYNDIVDAVEIVK